MVDCIYLEAFEGGLSALGLVWDHTTDNAPQNARGGAEVPGAASGVSVGALAEKGEVFHWTNKNNNSDDGSAKRSRVGGIEGQRRRAVRERDWGNGYAVDEGIRRSLFAVCVLFSSCMC